MFTSLKLNILKITFLLLITNGMVYAQYCSPSFGGTACSFPPYIDFSLSSASFSGVNFCSNVPCPTNYGDYYATYTANLTEGNSYQLTVNYNASSSLTPFSIYCGAWVDWNNDLVFDNATERIMTSNVGPAGAVTQTGAPFIAAVAGTFRMRIILQTGSNPTNPCNTGGGDNGEAKDFKIVVAPASVGTSELKTLGEVYVYPNPGSTNSLFIKGLNSQHGTVLVELFDVLGNLVDQKLISAHDNRDQFVEFKSNAQGVYYLNLSCGDLHKSLKIVSVP